MNDTMEMSYNVLLKGACEEIVVKKSRFLATIKSVETEEEAIAFMDEMKKKYWDATHNCSAFVIGSKGELTRCSDDGEPSGTAGRPMLEVLLREGIRNIAVVVTRYFGGTLLGTGGLVRAYTQAVQEGLLACQIGRMRLGCDIWITTDYNGIGKILYILGQRGIEPLESAYTEEVKLHFIVPKEDEVSLHNEMVEATSGKVLWDKARESFFVDKQK